MKKYKVFIYIDDSVEYYYSTGLNKEHAIANVIESECVQEWDYITAEYIGEVD